MPLDEFRDLGRAFHWAIASAYGNPLLVEVYGKVMARLFRSDAADSLMSHQANQAEVDDIVAESTEHHWAIVSALVRSDAVVEASTQYRFAHLSVPLLAGPLDEQSVEGRRLRAVLAGTPMSGGLPGLAARYAAERLAAIEGDVDRLVELLGEPLSSPHHFTRVVEAMIELDRPADALTWADRGIAETTGWQVANLLSDLVATLRCVTRRRRTDRPDVDGSGFSSRG